MSTIARLRWCARTVAASLGVFAFACGSSSSPSSPSTADPGPATAVLVGAGDIGMCGTTGPESTARLLDGIDGIVFTAGDNAYPSGSAEQFQNCYDPSWGRHRRRTRPAPGNHDYQSAGALPYFAYFGANAGPPGLGYYSFTAGRWHVVSLNTSQPMGDASAQLEWLRADLAETSAACVAAIWHHPLFSIGPNQLMPETRELWRALYDAGGDVVISAHDHMYERFAPQNADGMADSRRGLREFVVGTGGAELAMFTRPRANLETFLTGTFGVLKLTLQPTSYSWQFITITGSTADSGSDVCH